MYIANYMWLNMHTKFISLTFEILNSLYIHTVCVFRVNKLLGSVKCNSFITAQGQ